MMLDPEVVKAEMVVNPVAGHCYIHFCPHSDQTDTFGQTGRPARGRILQPSCALVFLLCLSFSRLTFVPRSDLVTPGSTIPLFQGEARRLFPLTCLTDCEEENVKVLK